MTNVSFDLVAFDKASQNLLKVAERFDKLADKCDRLDRKRVNVPVDADTRKGDRKLDEFGRKADRLDKSKIRVTVDGDKALNVLGLIAAGLSTIGHLAPAAVGAVAAAPAAIGVLAQGAGALMVSLSGVGDGVKALDKAEAGLAKGGEAAAAAQAKLDEELDKLSPSARSLAQALHGEVLPALHAVRDGVQSASLPRFEVALRNLLKLQPELAVGLSGTGRVLGDLAVRGSAMMTTGPWRKDFATIMASNNRSLDNFGTAGLHALDSMRSLTVAGGPLIERFSQATERGAELANQYIQTSRASGELDRFMDQAGDTLADFARTALQVVVGVTQLTMALGPLGGIVLHVLGAVAELLGQFASAHPTLAQFAAGAILATVVVTKLGTVITGLVATATAAKAGWLSLAAGVGTVRDKVTTATGALTVGRSAAQGFAEGLSGAGAAADRAGAAKGRLSGVVTGLGGKLGALGLVLTGLAIGYERARSKADEAAAAIAKGGDEAIRKVRELRAEDEQNSQQFGVRWLLPFSKWLGIADQGVEDLRGSMDAVGKAELAAAEAAANHQDKIAQFGPNSAEAKAAAEALRVSVDQLEQEQRAAGDSAKYHTDQLIQLQNTMLMQVDKDLAFRASLLAVEQAEKTLSEAVRDHGVASLEGRQASLQYEEALFRSINALGENVRAQNASKSASEQDRLAVQAQKDEIFRLVAAAGGAAPPALLRMAAGMSDADLRARGATVSVDNLGRRVVALPGGKTITIEANTGPAQAALNRFIVNNNGRQITVIATMQNRTGVPIRQLGGGALGAIVQPMALGGIRTMSGAFAQVVPPNTPRLIGDRVRGNESFIPWDQSARSLAILEKTARGMGFALAPVRAMAQGGMVRAEDGSMVPASFYSKRPGGPAPLATILAEAGARARARHAAEAAAAARAVRLAPIRFEFKSGGGRLESLIIELIREVVRKQGGDVQRVLGR